jgi:hypothetical protein
MMGELSQFYMFPWKYVFSTKGERREDILKELFL